MAAQFLTGQGFEDVYNLSGGIRAWQGYSAAGPAEMGMDLINGDETPAEMAVIAYGLEKGLADVYATLATSVTDPDVAKILTQLAEIEGEHQRKVYHLWTSWTAEIVNQESFEQTVATDIMEGGFTTDEFIRANREAMQTLEGLLVVAMTLEAQALDLYVRFARASGNNRVSQALYELADDEKVHLNRLGKLLEKKSGGHHG